jgi:acyl-CoA synthetase (AMP-forming)/AMP-acid ligase II
MNKKQQSVQKLWLEVSDHIALVDGCKDEKITYKQLSEATRVYEKALFSDSRDLIFLLVRNRLSHAVALVSLFNGPHVFALLDPDLSPDLMDQLVTTYRPRAVVGDEDDLTKLGSVSGIELRSFGALKIAVFADVPSGSFPDVLKLLLSTSGTTGSPKFVKLSSGNLVSNANAIGKVLGINKATRAFGHLKLHYSFGLSVLLSHLKAGASVVLTDDTITDKGFWGAIRKYEVTSFPGVPFHYQYLSKMQFERFRAPSLQVFTQAGGRCSKEVLKSFYDQVSREDKKFYIMYGQTEASPRMTTLPAIDFESRLDSVGCALPGGEIVIQDEAGNNLPPNTVGEVIYSGPNVMMGYAKSVTDLTRNDEMNGVLKTGDLGKLSIDGYLTITGRSARFAKVHGLRINLDEVENQAGKWGFPCAALTGQDKVIIYIEAEPNDAYKKEMCSKKATALNTKYKLPVGSIQVSLISSIPRKSNGKTDYQSLASG